MLTITQYEKYVDSLPRAAHDMEHITNFGKVVARGFVLLASTIERGNQRLTRNVVEALGGRAVDTDAARAKRAAERSAKERQLREQLAAIENEAHADEADAELGEETLTEI